MMQQRDNQPALSATTTSPEEVLPLQSTGKPRQHMDAGMHTHTRMCSGILNCLSLFIRAKEKAVCQGEKVAG